MSPFVTDATRYRAAPIAWACLLSVGGLYTGAGILLRLAFRHPIDRGEA